MRRQRKWLRITLYIARRVNQLGSRTLTACITAFLAAILIFAASRVGVIGAVAGIVLGAISAVLMDPHSQPRP